MSMKNSGTNLCTLPAAKMPGSLWHVRFYGYKDPGTKEEFQLLDVDIAIFGFLALMSDTGGITEANPRLISEASRDSEGKATWSESTVRRSIKRLSEIGFLVKSV